MSTKQETTNKYDPIAMGVFHDLQPGIKNVLLDAMMDPKKSSFFTQNWQNIQKMNQGMLARSIQNIGQNLQARGINSTSPLYASMMERASRASSANTNNAYMQALNMSSERQMNATRMAQGYNPLQTGQVTTTSGLGTWLPQAIGMGLSLAMPFMPGMKAAGAAGGGAGSLGGSMGSAGSFVSPVSAFNASNPYWFPNMPSFQR